MAMGIELKQVTSLNNLSGSREQGGCSAYEALDLKFSHRRGFDCGIHRLEPG